MLCSLPKSLNVKAAFLGASDLHWIICCGSRQMFCSTEKNGISGNYFYIAMLDRTMSLCLALRGWTDRGLKEEISRLLWTSQTYGQQKNV